jgi:hypothetical protein
MNEEIKKFWYYLGYDIRSNQSNACHQEMHNRGWVFIYWLYKGPLASSKIAADGVAAYSDQIKGPISAKDLLAIDMKDIKFHYCYNGKEYSEDEMLKVIKLIAFV